MWPVDEDEGVDLAALGGDALGHTAIVDALIAHGGGCEGGERE